MKIKVLFFSLLLAAMGGSLPAQTLTPAGSSTGSITTNAANCNTTNACIILHLASSNVGYSVTVSGTWTGTLTVEQSGDNQGSWTSATTTTANTLYTSALTPGITDVRVRGSAAMTGTAVVTITASGPATLQQVTVGASNSSSPGFAPGILASNYSSFSQQVNWGCSYANGSAIITCPSGTFTSADVGKMAYATTLNPAGFVNFTNATLTCGAATGASVTILSFQTSAQVTLSANCTQNSPANSPFVWGPDETTGVRAAFTAAANACSTLIWPAGGAIVTSNPAVTIPAVNCINNTAATRNMVLIKGQGQNVSRLVFAPNFDMTTCNVGPSSNRCLSSSGGVGSVGGYSWEDMLVTGYGANPVSAAQHYIIDIEANGYMQGTKCTGLGASNLNIGGVILDAVGPVSVQNSESDGCGAVPLTVLTAGFGNVQIDSSYFGDGIGSAMILSGELVSNKNIYGGSVGSANGTNVVNLNSASSLLRSTDDKFGNPGSGNQNTLIGLTASGAQAYFTKAILGPSGTNGTTLFLSNATNVVHLQGTTVGAGAGTGSSINTAASSSLHDDGGNTFATTNLISGNVFRSESVTGTLAVTTTITPSTGWGTTGAAGNGVTAVSGNTKLIQFTITATGTPAANPTISVTFPKAFLVAPICSIRQVGGTGAQPTLPFVVSAPTATATGAITWTGTPVAALTYIFQLSCDLP